MGIELRTSSATALGSATTWSYGGYASNAAVSTAVNAFYEGINTAANDVGHTDYRVVFVYNSGTTVMNNVTLSAANDGIAGMVTLVPCSVATGGVGSYQTQVIGDTTAPTQVTGSWGSAAPVGTLNPGQVKAVWVRYVLPAKSGAVTKKLNLIVSASEVIAG